LQEKRIRKLHEHLAVARKELAEGYYAGWPDPCEYLNTFLHHPPNMSEGIPSFFGHDVSRSIISSPPSREPSPNFPAPSIKIITKVSSGDYKLGAISSI